jgi:hypothetical protein
MAVTLQFANKPGLVPAGEALLAKPAKRVFFACQRRVARAGFAHFAKQSYANTNSTQKKGDPKVWVPPLRCGQPPVLGKSGVELELAFGSDNRSP